MTYYEKSKKRLAMVRGHVNPGTTAKDERNKASFDLDDARQALWSTLPPEYFETFECVSELHGVEDPSIYQEEKAQMRYDTNVFFSSLVSKMFEKGFTTPEKIADNIDSFLSGIVSLQTFDYNVLTKMMVQFGLYCKTIKNLGTEKHQQILLDGTSLKTYGCFGLTEIGHGSNTRGCEVTATYDPDTQEFVLNSPTNTSAKFWIGNLGKTAQNAVIFGQLITKGENKGLHAFVLEIRDRRNHVPHPGIEIGDCGDKLSANGIDNGWIKFDNYRIPRDGLLDRFGAVSDDGTYSSPIENDGARFANSIASLSGGRVTIGRLSAEKALIALTIALRYSVVRRQFGPPGQEAKLLSYPVHQHRLITKFADHMVHYLGTNRMVKMWGDNLPRLLDPKNDQTKLCHALCSNIKAFLAWDVQDTIAECRRACGGLGYSYNSLFGVLLGINELNQTWEGDNHVLMMQTQQFLFKCLQWLMKEKKLPETMEFLSLSPPNMSDYDCCIYDIGGLQSLFRARACHFVHKGSQTMMQDPSKTAEVFEDQQHFVLRDMCQAYHDTYLIDTYQNWLDSMTNKETRAVYEKLLLLHIQNKILANSEFFGEILGDEKLDKLKQSILSLLKTLRNEIILLTDVLPFANRALGQLGNEDLQVYQRVLQHLKATKGVTDRPSWWKLAYANN